jgi:amino acid adenylation domain-containing protein
MPAFLTHLLRDSAARDPAKLAVVGLGVGTPGSLTYGELDALSSQIARELVDMGVRPGDRVGIFMPKLVDTVAALYGIQKAGAAYVPIDPAAPPRRAGYILANCGVRALIGSVEKLRTLPLELLSADHLAGLVLIEENALTNGPLEGTQGKRVTTYAELVKKHERAYFDVPITDDYLAYILYTSGSTGEPKGVMISHRNSLTFVNWCFDTFRVTPEDRVASHAPFHFDLSVLDLFVTALGGATLYLVPSDLMIFAGRLAKWIATNEISIWYSVPSALIQLLEHGKLDAANFPKLRFVLFAGEVFPMKFLRALVKTMPHPRYLNLYGPTETNVCTYYEVKPSDIEGDRSEPVPIGKACENTEVFAVTEGREVAGVGQEGELWVRSGTVMKGYWGRPEDSAKFLAANFTNPHYPETVYRTGDIVRLMPSGDYQYLGRKDKMIKSRGYRIEIGEIEAAFQAHPELKEVAILAIPDDEVGARIVAYVAPQLDKTELERFCAERLPRYMMPEKLTFEDELPKTSTGKIDKALLERRAKGQ